MNTAKLVLAGAAALAAPLIYVAFPVETEAARPVSAPVPVTETTSAAPTAAVAPPRRAVRVILASPFDPPGVRQEAAAVSPALGVPEYLDGTDQLPQLAAAQLQAQPQVASADPADTAEQPAVAPRRQKVRRAARVARWEHRAPRPDKLLGGILSAFLQ